MLALSLAWLLAWAQPGDSTVFDPVSRAKALVTVLVQGHPDSAESRFDPDLRAKHPTPQLAAYWKQVIDEAGAFKRFADVRVDSSAAPIRKVILGTVFAREVIETTVTYGPTGHVTGLSFISR